MSYLYKKQVFFGIETICAEDNSGEVFWIPKDPANTDYQQYQQWLAEGNEPEDVTTNETE